MAGVIGTIDLGAVRSKPLLQPRPFGFVAAALSATGVIRPLQSRRNPATRRAVVMMA
jgi:hypothetical protein